MLLEKLTFMHEFYYMNSCGSLDLQQITASLILYHQFLTFFHILPFYEK